MIGLTKRQKETISFIRSFREQHGVMPSYREIAAGTGLSVKSTARVNQIMNELEARGAIRRLNGHARAFDLIEPDRMQAVLLNNEIFGLLRAYASGQQIGIDTAANELLRGALGAA